MNAASTKVIRNLALNIEVEVTEGRSLTSILEEIKSKGGEIGKTSLRYVINGERAMACGFEMFDKPAQAPVEEVKKEEPVESAPEVTATPAPVDADPAEEKDEEESTPSAHPASPWAILMNRAVSSGVPVSARPTLSKGTVTVAASDIGKLFDEVGKPMVKPVRRGSKVDQLMQLLIKGATFQEIQEAFGWSEGAVSSYLHYEPQAKGYFVDSQPNAEKGKRVYTLRFPQGVTEILYTK